MLNTHGMLAANQQQMRQVWPFLDDEPPVLLDWLPWSHTFGGNHNMNMVLAQRRHACGSTTAAPRPPLIDRTARNLADARPTLYFNVPAGYAALLPQLERDARLARAFLARLRLGFFAAAALPQQLWDRLEKLSAEHGGRMRMTTSWGLTETSPAATSAHYPITRSDVLGVPLPGVEVALVPVGEKHEVRVAGPNVTPGYHRRPDLTAGRVRRGRASSAPVTRSPSPTRRPRRGAGVPRPHRGGLQTVHRHLRQRRHAPPQAAVGLAGAAR